jgi:hypothetical protein
MDSFPTSHHMAKNSPFLRLWQWAFGGLSTMILEALVYGEVGKDKAYAGVFQVAGALSCLLLISGLALGILKRS